MKLPEHGSSPKDRFVMHVLDVRCHDSQGHWFNVEMQVPVFGIRGDAY